MNADVILYLFEDDIAAALALNTNGVEQMKRYLKFHELRQQLQETSNKHDIFIFLEMMSTDNPHFLIVDLTEASKVCCMEARSLLYEKAPTLEGHCIFPNWR